MERWCLRKYKSSLLIVMMIFMVRRIQGSYSEDEKKTLLEIKASLQEIQTFFAVDNLLSTWIDLGITDSEYCDWEGIKCGTISRYVTDLSLRNVYSIEYSLDDMIMPPRMIWPLNFSIFLHFKELRSLDLSSNYIGNMFVGTGLEWLSALKKLEVLNLSNNYIKTNIFPSLSELSSLKTLDLRYFSMGGDSSTQDISIFPTLENLEVLDLTGGPYNGSFLIKGTMRNLVHLNLEDNYFNDDILRSLAAFPSLKFLSLKQSFFYYGGRSLFVNEIHNLRDLEVLILSENAFNGTLNLTALTSFHHLEVLDLSFNKFVGSIPSTIKSLSSLKVISLAYNKLNGSLPCHGLCELKNLEELDLSRNRFGGNLCECFNKLSSLKLFDVSSNLFTGILTPSLISNLTSLEYVDFSQNKFEGSFSFSSFYNHTKLEVVMIENTNEKFEVITEEPIVWIPMFQLKVLVLSNCSINMRKGSVLPSFLAYQHKLHVLDMSLNSMHGHFPNWLIENNSMLDVLNLRSNLFSGVFSLFYTDHNIRVIDISENLIAGDIPRFIEKFLPNITRLDLSTNSLGGVIPSSIGDLGKLQMLDLSHNQLYGEVPIGLLSNHSNVLRVLKLSDNKLHGEVLSRNLSLGSIWRLYLDGNCFTGKFENVTTTNYLQLLDISNNFFSGLISGYWINNMLHINELLLRNNSFEGPFPCGKISFLFLDISENSFSGPIPSCLNMQELKHLHLGNNKFTGSIPYSFRNLTQVLTLDIGNNYLTGRIPKFLGELSNLRILLLRKNNFSGSIPKQLCQLTNVSLLDLSNNFISGSIPSCLHKIAGPSNQAFGQGGFLLDSSLLLYSYRSVLQKDLYMDVKLQMFIYMQDEVMFLTKTLFLAYKGNALNLMSGLDLSCNKLTGDIPKELGLLTQIRALNLSFNLLNGTIPVNFSNLANIESLDLSFNSLTGNVPSELIKLNSLAFFNVSYNNLSGKLPDLKAQFSTFTKESYEGNPLLCGPPLENDCTNESHVTHPSNEEGIHEDWYDIDMVSFYGSGGSTWFVFMLGFVALIYINSYWRRRWLEFVEECIYTCYFFFYDLVRRACCV